MAVLQLPRRPLWGRFRTVEAVRAGPWGHLFKVTEALTGEARALQVLPEGALALDELTQWVRARAPALPRVFEVGRTRAPIGFGADELPADRLFVLTAWTGEPPWQALAAPIVQAVVDDGAAVHAIEPEPTERNRAPDDLQLKPALAALEQVYIAEAMRRAGGNQTVAAKLLGLSRFGLQKKLKRAR